MMTKENSKNTLSSNNKDGKDESSDSNDMDERPAEVLNMINPINTPTRSLPSASRKSSPPKSNNAALPDHQRQSTFSSGADQTYANSQAVESTSEQIGDGSTSDVIDPSNIDTRTLKTCNSEKGASTEGTKILYTSEPPAGVQIIVQSNTSDPKGPPLVFVSSTGYEEETSSSQEQNDEPGDFAADDLLSGSPSKQVPSSGESEDSDDVEMHEFPRQPLQRFTTPEALEQEIRSVFEMISSHVNTEINKTRTKRETLEINLDRGRAFVRCSLSQTLGQCSAVSQRIASELQSTLTEREALEFIYQGPSRTNDHECAQCNAHENYGILAQGSYGACFQKSRRLPPSPSRGLSPSSTRGVAPTSSGGLSPLPSEGLTSSSGELAEGSSMVEANSDLSSGLSVSPTISRLFSAGYSTGFELGSENYDQILSGRTLQSMFGQMIQDLQHPEEQTQGIPQELFVFATRMILLLAPTTANLLNRPVPIVFAQIYFVGLVVGFSRAYSQWCSQRPVFFLSSRSVPRLLHGLPSNYHRDLLLMTQRSLEGSLNGPHRGFPHESSMSFSNTPIARFSRDHSLLEPSARTPFRNSDRGHGSELRSSLGSTSRSTRPSDRERPANVQERIHVLLIQLVLDLKVIRTLANLISIEYRCSSRNFERISSYLSFFESNRKVYREKEIRYAALESEISNDVQRYRREAFAILHIELLNGIIEHCISRFQYGAMLLRTHERLDAVRTLSNAITRVVRTAMSYKMWTKED